MSKLLAARTTPEILKALYEAIWLKRKSRQGLFRKSTTPDRGGYSLLAAGLPPRGTGRSERGC